MFFLAALFSAPFGIAANDAVPSCRDHYVAKQHFKSFAQKESALKRVVDGLNWAYDTFQSPEKGGDRKYQEEGFSFVPFVFHLPFGHQLQNGKEFMEAGWQRQADEFASRWNLDGGSSEQQKKWVNFVAEGGIGVPGPVLYFDRYRGGIDRNQKKLVFHVITIDGIGYVEQRYGVVVAGDQGPVELMQIVEESTYSYIWRIAYGRGTDEVLPDLAKWCCYTDDSAFLEVLEDNSIEVKSLAIHCATEIEMLRFYRLTDAAKKSNKHELYIWSVLTIGIIGGVDLILGLIIVIRFLSCVEVRYVTTVPGYKRQMTLNSMFRDHAPNADQTARN